MTWGNRVGAKAQVPFSHRHSDRKYLVVNADTVVVKLSLPFVPCLSSRGLLSRPQSVSGMRTPLAVPHRPYTIACKGVAALLKICDSCEIVMPIVLDEGIGSAGKYASAQAQEQCESDTAAVAHGPLVLSSCNCRCQRPSVLNPGWSSGRRPNGQ